MIEVRIGVPCRGGFRAARRRAAREAAETWPAAHRDSPPARMAKVWKIEEDRKNLLHRAFWATIGSLSRYRR